ncbi:hypothetical protein M0805_000615 [Coniferiporia weirii]|nr:hypothetical protein M0805_000615 [Coniferiporia weirii]
MKIPITMTVHNQTVSTNALIDSGTEGKFIDAKFVIKNHIPTRPLMHPIQVQNISGQSLTTTFLVTSLGKEDVILGLPWLKCHNPTIDWTAGTISINKVTTTTTLTQEHTKPTQPLEIMIPSQYHKYLHIFQKQAAECFPIARPYDHAIDPKPDFIPRDCKIYPLSPNKQLALDQFLEDNLCKGYIHPSKSPMASPFLFVGKKDSKL